ADTSYLVIAIALVLLGIGMGITVAPGTGSIMAAVPLNKAGVGSAVNDTTREVGGALGIAVLGSIANSAYRTEIDDAVLRTLPAEAADAAGESVGAAAQVAAQLPPEIGMTLAAESKDAFTTAFNTALGSGAVVAAVAGLVVWFVGRNHQPTVVTDDGG
ncbi:MAG: MFS transporter, partial [Acidimicrobiia bacterium]|nr:MFS transporter [Acidimicrobiia bacterium]